MQEPFERHETREPFAVRLRRDFRFAELLRIVQVQIDGADEPHERVQPEEGERADEQAGHAEENHVQQRIILFVHRVGVRPVFGKADGRAGMTLLAGGEDVGFRKVRRGIGRRQDVVLAVAIVTGGDAGRGVGFAQGHGLAVIGFAIMFQPVGVAFAATGVAEGLEIVVLGILDVMRRMAIRANRSARIAFGQQLPVNALVVGFLDAHMTFAAGFGDVGVVDGRIAVHGAFDAMRAVAIVAGRRHDESHLHQRPAVDAVEVLRRRLRMFHLIFLRQLGVVMTFGAGLRQIEFENRRGRIFHGQDVVRAVAVPAIGRAGSAERMTHAVDAGRVILSFLFMATGAIRRAAIRGCGPVP